jgi:hypothetical protein
MKLQIVDLKDDRQWAAVIGCKKAQFQKLLTLFQASYLAMYGKTVAERQAALDIPPSLPSEADLLLFTLFSLKSGLTYDALGFVSGMDGSNAKRNQSCGLAVLQQTLEQAQCLPARTFAHAEEFAAYFQNEQKLIFDGVEQRTQRPSQQGAQAACYSGKKSVTP